MRRFLLFGIVSVALVAAAGAILFSQSSQQEPPQHTMSFGGHQRSYLVHLPPQVLQPGKLPLVLVFHGGGGSAGQIVRASGFAQLADRHGFLAVFPQGVNKHWNDGRKSEVFAQQDRRIDDVAWIRALVEKLKRDYPVDPRRIYAVGISNGGMFCQRLAVELSDQLAAVASLTASLPEPLKHATPKAPVAVMLINGTADPLLPYQGGEVTIRPLLGRLGRQLPLRSRGRVISTEETIRYWVRHNGTKPKPHITRLPDTDPQDGCRVEVHRWSGGRGGTEVVLYKVIGGGHGWPGGSQYLGVDRIGHVCQDFDATKAIWQFFARHRKK